MLLLDYYSNRKHSWKMIVEKLPFFAISLIVGLIAIHSQKGATQDMAPNMSAIEHISVISFSFISYLFKALIPVNLSAIYPYPIELGGTLPIIYYLSILFVGLLLFFVWYSRRLGKDIVFGFLFFVITIILVLQFIPVGAASMADRYTYIPYIGVFFIIGKLFEYFSNNINAKYKKYSNYLLIVFIFGFITFSSISYGRVKTWENDETLFSDGISKYPYCSTLYFNRGSYYLNYYAENVYANNKTKRDMYINMSILDNENSLKFTYQHTEKAKTYCNLGLAKCDLGDFVDAISYLDKAIEIDSSYANSYKNRGKAKLMLKDYKAALEDCNKVIQLNPQDVTSYLNRGIIRIYFNDYIGVICDSDKAIKIDANNANSYDLRGYAKYYIKDYEGALKDYNKAIELNPEDSIAMKNRDVVKSILKNLKK
jgi:protein O-mannosyl-transferase